MKLGVPKETFPGERRVAIVPAVLAALHKLGIEVVIETGAGEAAGFPDSAYAGQATVGSRQAAFDADIVAQVWTPGANPARGMDDLPRLRSGQALIGFANPLTAIDEAGAVAATGARLLAMELVPRITRAQAMDALSSMATVAGYKAVILAADTLPRLFPMLNTAAGTVKAARVFVVGAGVAGLQAIATARRLGARVEAYDVRPDVREQILSVGARFVELPLEAGAAAADEGGYARAQDESFYRRQRAMMLETVSASDVVITTAAIPGQRSPVLVTEEMVAAMQSGSVIVDLAAERGGNCELTRADEIVVAHGVTILGPTNLPASVPYHASQLYARNVATLVQHLVRRDKVPDGKESGAPTLVIDPNDEITKEILVTDRGAVVHPKVRLLEGAR